MELLIKKSQSQIQRINASYETQTEQHRFSISN